MNNKAQSAQLLSDTDWCELPSVSSETSSPRLTNLSEFLDYRAALRAIAVNPPNNDVSWPTKPQAQWVR